MGLDRAEACQGKLCWRERKDCLWEGTVTSYISEEAKGWDLGHIRGGAPERWYMGEKRSRRAVGHPKLIYKSRQ